MLEEFISAISASQAVPYPHEKVEQALDTSSEGWRLQFPSEVCIRSICKT